MKSDDSRLLDNRDRSLTPERIGEVTAYAEQHTVKETAAHFGVPCSTMRVFVWRYRIPYVKLHRGRKSAVRCSLSELALMLSSGKPMKEVARELGVSYTTLSQYAHRNLIRKTVYSAL